MLAEILPGKYVPTGRKKIEEWMNDHGNRTGDHHVGILRVCVPTGPVKRNNMEDKKRQVGISE
jgi:hypothetical protein